MTKILNYDECITLAEKQAAIAVFSASYTEYGTHKFQLTTAAVSEAHCNTVEFYMNLAKEKQEHPRADADVINASGDSLADIEQRLAFSNRILEMIGSKPNGI